MKTIRFRWTGTRPLLVQNERLSNPLDPIAREIKRFTSKKKKTDEDHLQIAYLEFEGSFYPINGAGPTLPEKNVIACLRDGGRLSKKGKDVVRAISSAQPEYAIQYEGPRTIRELFEEKRFVDFRGVRLQGRSKTTRCRPVFPIWRLEPVIEFDASVFNEEELIELAKQAGKYIGIGTYRPVFGRFAVEVL